MEIKSEQSIKINVYMILVATKYQNSLYFSILSGCDLQMFWFRCVMENVLSAGLSLR